MLLTHSETHISQSPTASQRADAVKSVARRALALFSRAGSALWRQLEDVGQARTNLEARLLAARWANTDPELASQLRAASNFDARSQEERANHEVHLLTARR